VECALAKSKRMTANMAVAHIVFYCCTIRLRGICRHFWLRVGQGGVSAAVLCVGNTTLPKRKTTVGT